MTTIVLLLGIFLGVTIIVGAFKLPAGLRVAGIAAGVAVALAFVPLSSLVYVDADRVGVVKKNALGESLPQGRIIALDGQMGVQAEILPPGWHLWYWPVIYEVSTVPLTDVPADKVGLVEARDGQPLDPGQLFAPEVGQDEFKRMLEDASYFLGEANGRKGPQSNVLTPGNYRVNPELFKIELVDATDVDPARVAVLKSNFGTEPTIERVVVDGDEPVSLAKPGEKGVRADPLPPGKYPVNTRAYQVTSISTKTTIIRFTAAVAGRTGSAAEQLEQREITVRTSDGFTFPVDVRIEYKIDPANAPIVVAELGSDGKPLLDRLNSTVRAVFRNNAESVKALDYVNQRSQQESQSLAMIRAEMADVGVEITGVRIGDVGDEATLGDLLNTQRDREIAVQEQITFQEQQKAAEQKKELTRTEQEAEEEKRLATASYEVQIAEQAQQKRIIEAEAEAQAIQIEAQAQADAYRLIAEQIGKGNAAMVELLNIVGQNAIQITPRVMVTGGGGNGSDGRDPETVALIGTMLDAMTA
ncbi:MAG: SPFH domain-containing protein, partial [Planctomycetota bacterium]